MLQGIDAITPQSLPSGQHSIVVLPAKAIHDEPGWQQKLSGYPVCGHRVYDASPHVLSLEKSVVAGTDIAVILLVVSAAASSQARSAPANFAIFPASSGNLIVKLDARYEWI